MEAQQIKADHELKTLSSYFFDIMEGTKTFELRETRYIAATS